MPTPTFKTVETAIFALIDKDATTIYEKSLNDLLLDTVNESRKIIREIELEKLKK